MRQVLRRCFFTVGILGSDYFTSGGSFFLMSHRTNTLTQELTTTFKELRMNSQNNKQILKDNIEACFDFGFDVVPLLSQNMRIKGAYTNLRSQEQILEHINKSPLHNAGLVLPAGELVQIDVDIHDDGVQSGLVTWEEMKKRWPILSEVQVVSITPRGGLHLLALLPEGVERKDYKKQIDEYPQIEIKHGTALNIALPGTLRKMDDGSIKEYEQVTPLRDIFEEGFVELPASLLSEYKKQNQYRAPAQDEEFAGRLPLGQLEEKPDYILSLLNEISSYGWDYDERLKFTSAFAYTTNGTLLDEYHQWLNDTSSGGGNTRNRNILAAQFKQVQEMDFEGAGTRHFVNTITEQTDIPARSIYAQMRDTGNDEDKAEEVKEVKKVRELREITEDFNVNDNILELLKSDKDCVLVAPTGGGKSTNIAQATIDHFKNGENVLIIVPNNDLIKHQLSYLNNLCKKNSPEILHEMLKATTCILSRKNSNAADDIEDDYPDYPHLVSSKNTSVFDEKKGTSDTRICITNFSRCITKGFTNLYHEFMNSPFIHTRPHVFIDEFDDVIDSSHKEIVCATRYNTEKNGRSNSTRIYNCPAYQSGGKKCESCTVSNTLQVTNGVVVPFRSQKEEDLHVSHPDQSDAVTIDIKKILSNLSLPVNVEEVHSYKFSQLVYEDNAEDKEVIRHMFGTEQETLRTNASEEVDVFTSDEAEAGYCSLDEQYFKFFIRHFSKTAIFQRQKYEVTKKGIPMTLFPEKPCDVPVLTGYDITGFKKIASEAKSIKFVSATSDLKHIAIAREISPNLTTETPAKSFKKIDRINAKFYKQKTITVKFLKEIQKRLDDPEGRILVCLPRKELMEDFIKNCKRHHIPVSGTSISGAYGECRSKKGEAGHVYVTYAGSNEGRGVNYESYNTVILSGAYYRPLSILSGLSKEEMLDMIRQGIYSVSIQNMGRIFRVLRENEGLEIHNVKTVHMVDMSVPEDIKYIINKMVRVVRDKPDSNGEVVSEVFKSARLNSIIDQMDGYPKAKAKRDVKLHTFVKKLKKCTRKAKFEKMLETKVNQDLIKEYGIKLHWDRKEKVVIENKEELNLIILNAQLGDIT